MSRVGRNLDALWQSLCFDEQFFTQFKATLTAASDAVLGPKGLWLKRARSVSIS
jgi:hypothetical protein